MTETRKWTAGAALVAVLILVAGWFLLISPKRAEVADLQAQTAAQDDENSALAMERDLLKQQNKELPEKQAELAGLRTQIPRAPELPSYIRQLQDIGKASGVGLSSLTPATPVSLSGVQVAPGAALPPDELAAVNVDIVVTGTFFEIEKFVNELETTERYTLVGGVAMTDETSEAEPGADPVLTATLNARIYLVPAVAEAVVPAPGTTTAPSTEPAP
jgi:Tfp pilus assembly protein PilO